MSDEATLQGPSVFVISDVRILRDGLAFSLGREPDFSLVDAGPAAPESLRRILETAPQVVVVDIACSADLAFVAAIRERLPAATLVAFGVQDTEDEIVRCAQAGYSAYVDRNATAAELAAVVRLSQRNELMCSSRIAATLFKRLGAAPPPPPRADALTVRERQVRALMGEGLANKEIASRLGISVATVKNHVHHVLEKLHVDRRAHAARVDQSQLSLRSHTRRPAARADLDPTI